MAAYEFTKETRGFSIKKDGLKVSYGGEVTYRIIPRGTHLDIVFPIFKEPISKIEIDLDIDTVKVNSVSFEGTASELADSLRDEVLFSDEVTAP